MTRKHVVTGLVIAAAVATAVWMIFWFRHPTSEATKSPGRTKPSATTVKSAEPTHITNRALAPRWTLDVDPDGPLRLEGQVVDADGHGVGGAEVWIGSVPPRTAKTEGDGTFSFDKLVGRSYTLSARGGEQIGGPIAYKLTDQSDPVIIKIGEGAKVVVTVTEDDKHPIAAASVKVLSDDTFSATTGDDGKATLAPIHPGWVAVQVSAPGHAPANAFTTVGSAGATGQLEITLHRGVAVSGRVLDEAGKPLSKVRVTTSGVWDLPGGIEPVTTDDRGQFAIPALAAGSHTLVATDGEHAPGRSPPITIADRAVDNVEIVMKTGGTFAGIVVDTTHHPVPFATLRVDGKDNSLVASRQTTTDRAGKFELRGLARVKLEARAESDTAASKLVDVDLSVQPSKRDAQVVLDVAGTIAGVVVDDQGQPVAEVQVNAFPDILSGATGEGLAIAGLSSTTTDGAGAFTIRGLPDGAYRVLATRTSHQRDWGQQGTPAKTGDRDVKITLAPAGAVVGTIVIEGASEPPKLAVIQIGNAAGTPATAGEFRVDELAPGMYDAHIHGLEFAELIKHDIKIEAGKTTDLGKVTVSRGRKLAGKVVDANGTPVAGARVKVGDLLIQLQGAEDQMDSYEEAAGTRVAISDQDGAFTILGISKKHTNVIADHPDRGRSNATEIADGEADPAPLTLSLRGFGSIVGKVTLKGQPLAGVTITDTPKGGGSQLQIAQSDETGAFTITRASEGTHVLSAMQEKGFGTSFKSTSTTVQVVAGKPIVVALDIPVGTITLTVQIRALPNNKVDAAQVFLFHGAVATTNAKQLTQTFLDGGTQGMKIWFGASTPPPEFDELVPGDYSSCSIPITGNLADGSLQQRLQEHMDLLKVYCKPVTVAASPDKQTLVQDLPAMVTLPAPKS